MTTEERKHQKELAEKHAKRAFDLLEEAQVNFMIEKVLLDGLKAGTYERESLNNLAQSLTN
jgi:hypothetical protein